MLWDVPVKLVFLPVCVFPCLGEKRGCVTCPDREEQTNNEWPSNQSPHIHNRCALETSLALVKVSCHTDKRERGGTQLQRRRLILCTWWRHGAGSATCLRPIVGVIRWEVVGWGTLGGGGGGMCLLVFWRGGVVGYDRGERSIHRPLYAPIQTPEQRERKKEREELSIILRSNHLLPLLFLSLFVVVLFSLLLSSWI